LLDGDLIEITDLAEVGDAAVANGGQVQG
jgi:hypothetical protein